MQTYIENGYLITEFDSGAIAKELLGSNIPTPQNRVITPLSYMQRFTDSELATIYTSAKTVVSIEVWLAKFNRATEINLDDPITIGGLQAMEVAGLLAIGRASEILV